MSKMDSLESSWSSNAGRKIRQAMQDLDPKFREYKSVVESYVTFLKNAAGSYTDTETTAETNVNQVQFK